jgi:hypothetical protein
MLIVRTSTEKHTKSFTLKRNRKPALQHLHLTEAEEKCAARTTQNVELGGIFPHQSELSPPSALFVLDFLTEKGDCSSTPPAFKVKGTYI